jgi:hypothetical protein
MDKIKILKISKKVFSKKGFDSVGCHTSSCDDSCCDGSADVDKESYDLIFEHRKLIEKELGIKLEKCFYGKWSGDKEFLGCNSIGTNQDDDYLCMFRLPNRKGCVLYKLVEEGKAKRRIIPTICRLYPLTWDNGELHFEDAIEPDCRCLHRDNASSKSIFETQIKEIKDIFKISDECKKEIDGFLSKSNK